MAQPAASWACVFSQAWLWQDLDTPLHPLWPFADSRQISPSCLQELAAGNVDEDAALAQLKEVGRTYRLRLGTLLTFLQSNKLQSANRAPAVRQLILRLNFNDFLGQDVLTAALNPLT